MNTNNKKVGIITLGCRVNQYESAAIAEILKNKGYDVVHSDNGCDYYIVNTCAVTAESERKSRNYVRRVAKTAKVAVIGCASQINNVFKDIKNVIYVGGCKDKTKCVEAIINDYGSCVDAVSSMENAPYECMNVTDLTNVFSECRAFVKIEDGCNGKCTYCIIPRCRGRVRSRDADDVLNEVKNLAEKGYKEIILTGIEVSAYNKIPLPMLIKKVADIEGIERIRLGSLSPNLITEKFVSELKEIKKFMPHMHLSLQSCSDKILKGMKRPYTQKDIIDKVSIIKKYIPSCMLSADIIVGFPGETEEDFKESADILDDLSLFRIHSFPYSERRGTPAAAMDNQVPKEVRYIRNAELIKRNSLKRAEILKSLIGTTQYILVEEFKNGFAFGHTEGYIEAKLPQNGVGIGDIVEATVVGDDGNILECKYNNGGNI